MGKKNRKPFEILFLFLTVAAFNWWGVRDPAFSLWYAAPYVLIPILIAAFYGSFWALTAEGFAILLAALEILFPLMGPQPAGWESRVPIGFFSAALVLGAVLFLRRILQEQSSLIRQRFREVLKKNNALERENRALREVSLHLETRLSQQKKFLTFLLAKLNKLDRLNLTKALEEILDTVRIFSGAKQASIWQYRPEEKRLVLATSLGWKGDSSDTTTLSAESTIEGWVCRNGTPFTLRMVLKHDHYRRMDRGTNIITHPIRVGDRVWGVLNIEKMPFVDYSRYTENVVEIVIKLAEKSLKPIIEHEILFRQQETNPETGLPLVTILFKLLDQEIARLAPSDGVFSVVIIDVVNFEELVQKAGRAEFLKILLQFSFVLRQEYGRKIEVFHYKEDNQMAFVLPDLDADGAALFCLNLLGTLHEHDWKLNDERVFLEVVVGYNTFRHGISNAQALLEQAEHILQMQKV